LTEPKGVELPAELCGELFSIIDVFLAGVSGKSLVDSNEVQDFCLDIRQFIFANMEIKDSI
jgi:hypothetical protein